MDYLQRVQRGIDYIEAHLDAEVDVGSVARQAGISPWHFQRIFKALTQETLAAYIRARRFSQSLQRLAQSRERVLEIALASGFESQASFTRAFKAAFGITPARYRQQPQALALLPKLKIDAEYLRHLQGQVSLEPEIVEQGALELAGLRTRFHGPESAKNTLGDQLPRLWAQFLPLLDRLPQREPGRCYGVVRQTSRHGDELEYWAAAPVRGPDPLPAPLERLQLPASRYARFVHKGLPAELDQTVNYIYSSWLLRAGLRHSEGADLEIYDEQYQPDSVHSLMHYAIPIAD